MMAEREGFEPSKGVSPCRFSRPVHSTALPPLRVLVVAGSCLQLSEVFLALSIGQSFSNRESSYVLLRDKTPRLAGFDDMAESEGFEPSVRGYRTLAFQASPFDRSGTSP